MSELNAGGAKYKDHYSNDPYFNITDESFRLAREEFLSLYMRSPEEGLRMIFKDQMFNAKFRHYVESTCDESSIDLWREIESDWKIHEDNIVLKDKIVEKCYVEMSDYEYDTEFQAYLMKGLLAYYKQSIYNYPRLAKFVENNSLWELYLVISIREVAPIKIFVNDQVGPLAPHSYTPLNVDGVLSAIDNFTRVCEALIPNASPEQLLEIISSESTESKFLEQLRLDNDESIEQAKVQYWSVIDPLRDKLRFGPWSAIDCADGLLQMASGRNP
jgi:hypothetical protein